MDRTVLQQLSKDKLIELVLWLQRHDKNSRTCPSPLRRTKRKSVRTLSLAGPSQVMSNATVGWLGSASGLPKSVNGGNLSLGKAFTWRISV